MNPPLEESYLHWLSDQVGSVDGKIHSRMLEQLFFKEFVWFVPNDDNRAADGTDLRTEFLGEIRSNIDPDFTSVGCCMLELFVCLARRASFFDEHERDQKFWFWHLIKNADLYRFDDRKRPFFDTVDDILDKIIFRRYGPDGQGGIFPLKSPCEDQRGVELWYQLSAYLLERV
jgi:hypothetical protein